MSEGSTSGPARGRFTPQKKCGHCYGNCADICLKMPPVCVCVCTHHDDQQYILEVVPEAQCGAAEQREVSLQELQDGAQRHTQSNSTARTHKYLSGATLTLTLYTHHETQRGKEEDHDQFGVRAVSHHQPDALEEAHGL